MKMQKTIIISTLILVVFGAALMAQNPFVVPNRNKDRSDKTEREQQDVKRIRYPVFIQKEVKFAKFIL